MPDLFAYAAVARSFSIDVAAVFMLVALSCVSDKEMCDKEICGILLRDTGYGIRDTGHGIRERVSHIAGYGTRDTGYGMRDTEWIRHGPGLAYGIREACCVDPPGVYDHLDWESTSL